MAREKNKYELANEEFFANLLAGVGVNPNEKSPGPKDLEDSAQAVDFRGQGVLEFLAYPDVDKIAKHCRRCGEPFATNYRNVAYCSRHCIELHLKEKYGLAWFPAGDLKKERWEFQEEPQLIPMQALVAMKRLVMDVEKRLGSSIPTESGEWDNQLPPLVPEKQDEKEQSLPEPPEGLKQPQIPAEKNPSHIPELTVPSEQSESNLEDWLFDE